MQDQHVIYDGAVPKTLRDACERNADKVEEVCARPGDEDDWKYEIVLRPGWSDHSDPGTHCFFVPNVKEAIDGIKRALTCDCAWCKSEKAANAWSAALKG